MNFMCCNCSLMHICKCLYNFSLNVFALLALRETFKCKILYFDTLEDINCIC